jgi:hypothetical protein
MRHMFLDTNPVGVDLTGANPSGTGISVRGTCQVPGYLRRNIAEILCTFRADL